MVYASVCLVLVQFGLIFVCYFAFRRLPVQPCCGGGGLCGRARAMGARSSISAWNVTAESIASYGGEWASGWRGRNPRTARKRRPWSTTACPKAPRLRTVTSWDAGDCACVRPSASPRVRLCLCACAPLSVCVCASVCLSVSI